MAWITGCGWGCPSLKPGTQVEPACIATSQGSRVLFVGGWMAQVVQGPLQESGTCQSSWSQGVGEASPRDGRGQSQAWVAPNLEVRGELRCQSQSLSERLQDPNSFSAPQAHH